jgi:glucose dehydrogenase
MKGPWIVIVAVALTVESGVVGRGAQAPPPAPSAAMPGRDWLYHGGDPGAMRYSTLSQINADNVKTLKRAWVFRTGHTSGTFETTPLVLDSVMYITAPNGVYAIDAVTGKEIWKYAPVGPNGSVLGASTRGVQYWPGSGGLAPRLFTRTANGLTALAMKTGEPVSTFGENGVVPNTGTSTSPPSIYRDVVMIQDNGPNIQAYDARTGGKLWQTELIAQPGDPNHATWLNDSSKAQVGGTDVWGIMSIDPERGLLFAPISKTGNDYWGGPHHGNNLYSDCVVAIDATTGKMVWYFQTVHHDIWDFDLGAAPALVEVRRNGQVIPGVAQITKMGLLFVLHRETGQPIYGVEERPVPQTKAPGEWTSPTQPFPLRPPPLARMSMTKAELAGIGKISPDHEAFCRDLWERHNVADSVPYEPWRTDQPVTVHPGALGGGNWGGVSFHRGTGFIVTNIHNTGQWGVLEPAGAGRGRGGRGGGRGAGGREGGAPPPVGRSSSEGGAPAAQTQSPAEAQAPAAAAPSQPMATPTGYGKRTPEQGRFWSAEKRWPCNPGPWGELVAINTATGDVAWRSILGGFEELEAKGIRTGTAQLGGAITTAGSLVFIGATIDSKFRAFDVRNGAELWVDRLDAPAHSVPSTYLGRDGKQYVVVAAGGRGFLQSPGADTLVAYTLP